jgi:hypothetical protein
MKKITHQSILLLFIIATLISCENDNSVNQSEDTVSNTVREIENWVSREDIKRNPNETLIFEGYVSNIKIINNEAYAILTPRHCTNRYNATGQIQIQLSNNPLFAGYDSVVTKCYDRRLLYDYQRNRPNTNTYIDSFPVTNWEVYLNNGDTLTDEFLNRSKVWVRINVDKNKVISLDSLYVLDNNLEEDYAKAVPLTKELGRGGQKIEKDQYTYCYLDGYFEVPQSVNGEGTKYSYAFDVKEGFHEIKYLSILIGEVECGKTHKLHDNYLQKSIRFWDAKLDVFGADMLTRVYGLWEARNRTFKVEEFVILDTKLELNKTHRKKNR